MLLSSIPLEGIERNFNFIVLEVIKQVEDTKQLLDLEEPDRKLVSKIRSRDDYIDNLKTIIGDKCFQGSMEAKANKETISLMRSVNTIASNLERIADHAENISRQTKHFTRYNFIKEYDYPSFFEEVVSGIRLVIEALTRRDLNSALSICRKEHILDELFSQKFVRIIKELKTGEETENLVTTLFILRYLERMGDCLLNIGEAIIMATVGEKLKIHDYNALEGSLHTLDIQERKEVTDFKIAPLFETKSGCKIRRINEVSSEEGENFEVIFKDGQIEKMKLEKESIQKWDALHPGLTPRIIDYQQNDSYASMLIEYLHAPTIQHIVLNSSQEEMNEALYTLMQTLQHIWEKTKEEKPVCASFIQQLNSRLKDIYSTHPSFKKSEKMIGSLFMPSLSALLDEVRLIEEQELHAPFSVFIHGDFNTDNILYNFEKKQLHFIDLHRSASLDYAQDIAVFIVSNYRMPLFDAPIRKRLQWASETLFRFALDFAERNNDHLFQARVSLGIARTLITSTRFEINKDFAKEMYLRGVYLLEKILASSKNKSLRKFRLPEDIFHH